MLLSYHCLVTIFNLVSYIGGLIMRHLCQLVGNAHAITELNESENGAVQQVCQTYLMVTHSNLTLTNVA